MFVLLCRATASLGSQVLFKDTTVLQICPQSSQYINQLINHQSISKIFSTGICARHQHRLGFCLYIVYIVILMILVIMALQQYLLGGTFKF